MIRNGKELAVSQEAGRCGIIFQIQGADCVEDDLDRIEEFYHDGLRVLQLTHHYNNKVAGGALSLEDIGLTPLGESLMERLVENNMLLDLSHSSEKTALAVLKRSDRPVIQSHGAVRSLVNHARCSTDEVIRRIGDSGGCFGVFMMSFWLTSADKPEVADYVRHLKHVSNIAGIDAVAIANDYPLQGQKNLLKLNNDNREGVKPYLPWWYSLREKGVLGFDHEPKHVVIPHFNHIHRMERIDRGARATGIQRQ